MFIPSIVILSTLTDHHIYFINRIIQEFSVKAIFFETLHLTPRFPVGPLFEDKEISFEKDHFFVDVPSELPKEIPIHKIPTVNHPGIAEHIASYKADLGIVFGCGKIKPNILNTTKDGLINLHRGTAEEYRGLDSDLWAIYHKDFENIGVTIHKVEEKLDTGDVLKYKNIKLKRGMKIHQIRHDTTVLATDLVLEILREYKISEKLNGCPQKKKGRYYSFMPLELKKIVAEKFNTYTEKLSS